MSTPWTAEEERLLVEMLAAGSDAKSIANTLGRSVRGIRRKKGRVNTWPCIKNPWTPKTEAELARLWSTALSTREIGAAMGVSKNAVVGKAARLQLPARLSPIGSSSGGARAALAFNFMPQLPTRRLPRTFQSSAWGAPPKTCQWIEGEPSLDDACKCGFPTSGRSYCAGHHSRAYRQRDRLEIGIT